MEDSPNIIAPFEPKPWQVAPWRDTSPVLLMTGSAGGGKSTVAAEKIHAFALRYPGATGLILRKNREAMTNSTILFFEQHVVGHDPTVVHRPSKHRFEYKNGSIVAYGGMADREQREQIRSIGQSGGVDICWMEEATAFVEEDFNEIRPRMRGRAAPWRQIVLTTNPDAPSHWIYQRLIQGMEAKVYYSTAQDNNSNPDDYAESLAKISGVQGLRLREGRWVQAEGVVYEEWDRKVHVVERFPIPPTWRIIRVVDFGFNNPFVCQWWAIDPDGAMYLIREIYKTQRIVEDHAARIVALSRDMRIEATVADHDAEDRATLLRYGVPTVPAHKAVTVGIQAVQTRLRIQNPYSRPRLYLMQNSLSERDEALANARKPWCSEQEFESYVWTKGQDGKPQKEEPVKENDHGMDCARYAVCYVDKIGAQAFKPTVGWRR